MGATYCHRKAVAYEADWRQPGRGGLVAYTVYKIYIQCTEFRAHSVFQGKRKLLKNPECKKYIQYSENFQGKHCFQDKRKLFKNP